MTRGVTPSASPENTNYDVTMRLERMKILHNLMSRFAHLSKASTQALRSTTDAMASVGHTYFELSEYLNNTNPYSRSKPNGSCISYNNRLLRNYGADLQHTAEVFAAEAQKIKTSGPSDEYREAMFKKVNNPIDKILKEVQSALSAGKTVEKAIKKLSGARKDVAKKEAKYLRKGRSLTESKRYEKQLAHSQKMELQYTVALNAFDTQYDAVNQRLLYEAGHAADNFLQIHLSYMGKIVELLGCIAPQGQQAVMGVVSGSRELSARMGIVQEPQLGSAPSMSPDPMDVPFSAHTVRSSRMRRSAHNFTSYYQLRADDDGVEEGPSTVRANSGSKNSVMRTSLNAEPFPTQAKELRSAELFNHSVPASLYPATVASHNINDATADRGESHEPIDAEDPSNRLSLEIYEQVNVDKPRLHQPPPQALGVSRGEPHPGSYTVDAHGCNVRYTASVPTSEGSPNELALTHAADPKPQPILARPAEGPPVASVEQAVEPVRAESAEDVATVAPKRGESPITPTAGVTSSPTDDSIHAVTVPTHYDTDPFLHSA